MGKERNESEKEREESMGVLSEENEREKQKCGEKMGERSE